MSAALATASARPSGGAPSRFPNPRAPGGRVAPSSKTPSSRISKTKTRRLTSTPPRALPPTSVPKLKQQLARSRITPPVDGAELGDGATGSSRSGAKSGGRQGATVSSKRLSRLEKIARLMESEGSFELYGASRINTYATSERYDLSVLTSTLRSMRGVWTEPEALDDETISTRLCARDKSAAEARQDEKNPAILDGLACRTTVDTKIAFFFEYGIVVFWGLTPEEERKATRDLLEACEIDPYPADDVEVDTMFFAHADPEDPNERERFTRPSPSPSFRLQESESLDESETMRFDTSHDENVKATSLESLEARVMTRDAATAFKNAKPFAEIATVVDDVVAIPPAQAGDAAVMLAASHALAQSTKLALYEKRAALLADATESIPRQMATTGETSLTSKQATKLRGRCFLQRADLNVFGAVLDSPAFLWQAPDRYARLYEATRDYLEVETRAETLNARLNVLEDLVSAVVANLETEKGTRLELIVIWLIVIEVVIGLVEIWGIVGLGKE
jgi:uncharacterized Rmd1/YagE family protein